MITTDIGALLNQLTLSQLRSLAQEFKLNIPLSLNKSGVIDYLLHPNQRGGDKDFTTNVYTYEINTVADLENISDEIFDSMVFTPMLFRNWFGKDVKEGELYKRLHAFQKAVFKKDDISKFHPLPPWSIVSDKLPFSLYNEQMVYLGGIETFQEKYIRMFYKDPINKRELLNFLSKEQLSLNNHDFIRKKDCKVWLIVATLNSQPYGAIFAFQDRDQPKNLTIQGISKFLIPQLFVLLDPDASDELPKLNSLLINEVEKLGKKIEADKIVVNPLKNQHDILIKHYNFRPIDGKKLDVLCTLPTSLIGISQLYKSI